MPRTFQDDRQRRLFAALADEPRLVFVCGPRGVSVYLVGRLRVRRVRGEDLLGAGDGTDHVHVDWSRVRDAEESTFHGEGLLTFRDGDEDLFRIYRPEGVFPPAVSALTGRLV